MIFMPQKIRLQEMKYGEPSSQTVSAIGREHGSFFYDYRIFEIYFKEKGGHGVYIYQIIYWENNVEVVSLVYIVCL